MKTKSKIMIGLAAVSLSALSISLVACTTDGGYYGELNKDGKSIRVCYDFNDGLFQSTKDVMLVDTIDLKQFKADASGNVSVKLLSPDDEKRDKGTGSVTRTGYFLAGWYQNRELRTSANGEPLDVYGNVLHSGKDDDGNDVLLNANNEVAEQGYVYDGLWDFKTSRLTLDANENYPYVKDEYQLTLYAAWVPYYRFDYYAQDENGNWQNYGSTSFDYKAVNDEGSSYSDRDTISMPDWKDGAMNYFIKYADNSSILFPSIDDKTFETAYTDPAKKNVIETSIVHTGNIDMTHGIAIDPVMNIYTDWKDGVWYEISTAEQLSNNGNFKGNYNINADLDFTDIRWPNAFANGTFSGTFNGNGHTISNISVYQSDSNYTQTYGGLFAQLTATANVTNVTFKDATYEMGSGSRLTDVYFGLFAGKIDEEATVENVAVSGDMIIGSINPNGAYSLGLISGNGINKDISFENVSLSLSGKLNGSGTYDYTIEIKDNAIDPTDGTFEIATKDHTSTDEIITIKK